MPSTPSERMTIGIPSRIVKTFDPELKRAFDFAHSEIPEQLRRPENVKLDPEKLRLSGDGIFFSLQGEGITMGEPAVFLRLHVCNLRCDWCDAWYTWNPKTEEFWTESSLHSINETATMVKDAWQVENPLKKKRLIITGGEPLIQQNQVISLVQLLRADDSSWQCEIETNGTIIPHPYIIDTFQINCSPKLKNSLNSQKSRINPNVLGRINRAPHSFFKFVVKTVADLDEIESDFLNPLKLDPEKIILMPEGVTEEEIINNMRSVAEYAKIKGFRLLGRLHVSIWGAQRKV